MSAIRRQPRAWTPLRIELERIAADDQWHLAYALVARLGPYVDPRLAARTWFREHMLPRGAGEDETLDAIFARDERAALAWGRRAVILDEIRWLVKHERFERRGHQPGRPRRAWEKTEVRLAPAVHAREAAFDAVCFNGHPKPTEGWPRGHRKHCLVCQRARRLRFNQRHGDVAAD